jgi:hypothetical protein
MLLDMLAAVARKDYVDRRRRQAQGKPRRKQKVAIKAAQKMLNATLASAACSPLVSPGDQSGSAQTLPEGPVLNQIAHQPISPDFASAADQPREH